MLGLILALTLSRKRKRLNTDTSMVKVQLNCISSSNPSFSGEKTLYMMLLLTLLRL